MQLDPLIHAPARLAILSHLYVVESADATWMLAQTGLTWGNLSSHMTKLEDTEYIQVKKEFKDRKPTTLLQMTKKGRAAFDAYRAAMRDLLD